jgi:hypothetical protein
VVDKVKLLKYETINGGSQNNRRWPNEIDPSEDYAVMRGVSFEGSDDTLIDTDTNGDIRFVDTTNPTGRTLKNITDQLNNHKNQHLPNGSDPLDTATPVTIGTANSEGNANSFARSNHVHDHGAQNTPNHHAVATTSANGFLSSTDKTRIDSLRLTKSGVVAAGSFAGNPKKATLTFSTPFPNADYSLSVIGGDARSWQYESKTAGSIVINSGANQSPTQPVLWIAIQHGESV